MTYNKHVIQTSSNETHAGRHVNGILLLPSRVVILQLGLQQSIHRCRIGDVEEQTAFPVRRARLPLSSVLIKPRARDNVPDTGQGFDAIRNDPYAGQLGRLGKADGEERIFGVRGVQWGCQGMIDEPGRHDHMMDEKIKGQSRKAEQGWTRKRFIVTDTQLAPTFSTSRFCLCVHIMGPVFRLSARNGPPAELSSRVKSGLSSEPVKGIVWLL